MHVETTSTCPHRFERGTCVALKKSPQAPIMVVSAIEDRPNLSLYIVRWVDDQTHARHQSKFPEDALIAVRS